MSDSQDASLDEDIVFPRVLESSPEFYYSEPRRRALECLLSAGPAAFHTQLSLERVNNFLSESEISELHNHVTDFVPTEVPLSSWKREPAECLSDFSERYWPEYSDVPAPCLDLGWPDDGGGWKGITRATVYTHPPHEREPPIREVVRRGIQEASKRGNPGRCGSPPSLFHTSVNWFLAKKLQQEVETQEPSKGLNGRVAVRDTGPTPELPVGDPTLPQFSGQELPPPHSVQRPDSPSPSPFALPGASRGGDAGVARFPGSLAVLLPGTAMWIAQSRLVAVVTDRLTDGDVFHDLVAVARRGVAVYILLEQRGEESFREMREREGERGGGGEENMRVRVVGGVSFCSHDGKMVSGEMKEKFILIDHETVITGSYRRGVAVYILLEQRGEESFREMREREGERGGGGEENMRVRVVGGVSFCSSGSQRECSVQGCSPGGEGGAEVQDDHEAEAEAGREGDNDDYGLINTKSKKKTE
ncbi:UNVERIFIED_CONTAM: hypothetical protein FKN15_048872 [Acipenser sinensis]